MDDEPGSEFHASLTGIKDTSTLTTDPFLLSSVQPVEAPPTIKPRPPCDPPPSHVSCYNPSKFNKKFTKNWKPYFECVTTNWDKIKFPESETMESLPEIWDNTGNYIPTEYKYQKYQISKNTHKRKKREEDSEERIIKKRKLDERFNLSYLGISELEGKAILEELNSKPKLRYGDELQRDIHNTMHYISEDLTKKLSNKNCTIQDIYPTSNGINKYHIKTQLGLDPKSKYSTEKLRGSLLSKSISTMIYAKQKDELDSIIECKKSSTNIIERAKEKSMEIARKLGYIPNNIINNNKISLFPEDDIKSEYGNEDGEIKDLKYSVNNKMYCKKEKKNNLNINKKNLMDAYYLIKKNNNKNNLAPTPNEFIRKINKEKNLKNNMNSLIEFKSNTILKNDGYEYNKDGNVTYSPSVTKYDHNFKPMFPITNKDYQFSIVSKFGYNLLKKYGFREGLGLGRYNQGVRTFPRLNSQTKLKGLLYYNNKNSGFIHCISCDKSFSSYKSLYQHTISKNHAKKLSKRPNNLVLLCVYCNLQFESPQKIKEHFLLIKHNDPAIDTFIKNLKLDLEKKRIAYIQNLKFKNGNLNEFKNEKINEIKPNPILLYNRQQKKILEEKKAKEKELEKEKKKEEAEIPQPHEICNMPKELKKVTDFQITDMMSEDIKAKLYILGIELPHAVPNVPWIFCPSCKAFFTTFEKYNSHYNTQRHISSFMALDDDGKMKFNEFQAFLNQLQHKFIFSSVKNKK